MIDVAKILEELKQEKEQLEQAIITLERLSVGRVRRGRPPNGSSGPGEGGQSGTPKRRGRPPGSKNKVHDTAPKDSAVA
jgi:hypothetical protein